MLALEYTPYIWPFIISLLVTISLAIYAYRHRNAPAARTFMWVMICMTYWTLCYTLELASATEAGKIFWAIAKYPGATAGPVFLFVLSLQLTRHERWLTRPVKALLALFVIVTCVIVFTNPWHQWYWTSISYVPGFPETIVEHGWYFWIYAAISYIFVLTTVVLYFRYYRNTPSYYRRQAALLAVAGFIPLSGRIIEDFLGIDIFPKIDNIILLMLPSALLFAVAIFYYGALNIVHIAHNLVIKNIQTGIVVLDLQQRIIELNPYASQLLGNRPAQAIGKPVSQVWSDWPSDAITSGTERELVVQRDDQPAYYSLRSSEIRETDGSLAGYACTLFNITARKLAEQQLERVARTDALTGVMNRGHFYERAAIEWSRAERAQNLLSVLMIDIDNFKQINDRYGHHAGDEALKRVASECQRQLRPTDLFARYGGEEFICVFGEGAADAAMIIAERLRRAIEETEFDVDGQLLSLTVSLGIAQQVPNRIGSLDALIQQADQALYRSKVGGRNRLTLAQ